MAALRAFAPQPDALAPRHEAVAVVILSVGSARWSFVLDDCLLLSERAP